MIAKTSKDQTRQKVHSRIRKKVQGTQERPRLNVYRSVNHIYAQVIDDAKGATLVSATSVEKGKGIKGEKRPTGGNLGSAKEVGKLIAERAKKRASRKWCSIAAATCTTDASRPWPMRHVKRD